jgi:hypothetical protein
MYNNWIYAHTLKGSNIIHHTVVDLRRSSYCPIHHGEVVVTRRPATLVSQISTFCLITFRPCVPCINVNCFLTCFLVVWPDCVIYVSWCRDISETFRCSVSALQVKIALLPDALQLLMFVGAVMCLELELFLLYLYFHIKILLVFH